MNKLMEEKTQNIYKINELNYVIEANKIKISQYEQIIKNNENKINKICDIKDAKLLFYFGTHFSGPRVHGMEENKDYYYIYDKDYICIKSRKEGIKKVELKNEIDVSKLFKYLMDDIIGYTDVNANKISLILSKYVEEIIKKYNFSNWEQASNKIKEIISMTQSIEMKDIMNNQKTKSFRNH